MVTPKRPLATCLMALRLESPLGMGSKRRGSSPPSPVLDLPPMRFMAMASASWDSALMEPKLMAPVAKRLTISLSGSTSSRSMAGPTGLNRNRPRRLDCAVLWVLACSAKRQ